MKIRKATVEDAEAILCIYAPYIEKTAITYEYDVPSVKEFRERMGFKLCGTFNRCAVKFGRTYSMVWMEKFI